MSILPPPPNKPVSVELTRALAEAADGFPGMPEAFFVARYVSLGDSRAFEIRGPFLNWESVSEGCRALVESGDAGFFGPFDTTAARIPVGERAEHIEVRLPGGEKIGFDPTHADALFFSAPAVEKFALPYYQRLFGPEYAEMVMAQFRFNAVQVMAHFPWSEYTDPPKPPLTGPVVVRLTPADGPKLVPVGHAGVVPPAPLCSEVPARAG